MARPKLLDSVIMLRMPAGLILKINAACMSDGIDRSAWLRVAAQEKMDRDTTKPKDNPTMNLITKLNAWIAEGMTVARHAAVWLVGAAAATEVSVHTLEADSPLVQAAISAGRLAASEHGIPVAGLETLGADALEAAKELAGPAPTAA